MLARRALLLAGLALARPARGERWAHGLLWRVAAADGGAPSHLFGTLHVDDRAAKDFAAPVLAALAAARLFRPEFNSDPASGRVFAAATQLPPGPGLRELAGAALFERVAGLLAVHYGLPPAATDRLKPWAAFLQLSQPPRSPGETVDAALERRARALGLPVQPMETVQEQIAALEALELSAQLTLLDAQSRQHDASGAALATWRALYLAQDLAGLARAQRALGDDAETVQALDTLLEHLLYRRSEHMALALAADLRHGGVFVAVGALHLHGERGLPALLARQGLRVEPLG
ncbi:MAG TPA: TraB/GumN family protein [Methylibium sp.]|nr:TraB/GumN family protein [Methylibium sp.]